ncbi:MAG: hypothetical protein WCC87_07260 [Candidatus Korobacteraceae bacterium]
MLRADESAAWAGFLAADSHFAGEDIVNSSDGPDPPDVVCVSASGRNIGVELTKWVEHDQVTKARGRESLENSYLRICESEKQIRPEHIGIAFLHDKSLKMKPADAAHFRAQLFDFLARENAKPEPSLDPLRPIPDGYWNTLRSWENPQGARVSDFSGFPILEKYLKNVWILPRDRHRHIPPDMPWVVFESPGGPYTPDWMVQAAVDRILSKVAKYQSENLRAKHSLAECDLICFYCDEALLHNTPIEAVNFGFQEVAAKVKQALATTPVVFDRIFLFHPYEEIKAAQVYGG